MKFLVIAKPSFIQQGVTAAVMRQEAVETISSKLKSRLIDGFHNLADDSGTVAVVEADSDEELIGLLLSIPVASLTEFETHPLDDLSRVADD